MKNCNATQTAKVSCEISLDNNFCDLVVKGAVHLLAKHGIKLTSSKVRKFFSSVSGVRLHADRVCFTKEAIYGYLEQMRTQAKPLDPNTPFSQGQSWTCLHWADAQKGIVRPATEEDLIRAIRFLDAYGVSGFVAPVSVNSFPPALRDLHGTRICMENPPQYGAPTNIPGEKELDLYKQMSRVVDHNIWVLAMLILSPMRFDDAVLEFVLDHRDDKELAIQMTGGMPCPGSTSPLVLPAAYAQGLAEDLAACIFIHAVTGEYPAPYLRSDPFDMRFGNYSVGTPEYALLDLGSRQLFRYLVGVPREWGYFLSMSRWPDQQAAHERTVSCWLQALSGAVCFHGSGQLSSDEVYSLEQVVIDRTIMKGAERLVKGLKWETGMDRSYQVLEEGFARGSFLDHDATLQEYKEFYCERELFPAMNLDQWNNRGQPTPLSMASAIIEKYIARNTFRRDKHEIRELRRICKHGEEVLV